MSISIQELELHAYRARANALRMVKSAHHGHIGGAFSCIDIITALYFKHMNFDKTNPSAPDRDRFILSAGHKCLAQYGVLAELGVFSTDVLDTYGTLSSKVPGHPNMHKLPGIEANTGALGHGLSIALGMALGLRATGQKVYTILGDGELAEGSNWEAIAAAAHHKADNLVAIVDYNGLQISGKVEEVMNFCPIAARFAAFGWATIEIDGNNMEEIVAALDKLPLQKDVPSLIVAHTVKAKGLSFGENKPAYHFWSPSDEELERGMQEVSARIDELEGLVK